MYDSKDLREPGMFTPQYGIPLKSFGAYKYPMLHVSHLMVLPQMFRVV